MANATCSDRRMLRWNAALLAAVLSVGLSAGSVAHTQEQAQEEKQQAAKPRKTKRVKALSLAAQSFVLRVTRILEKAGDVSDEASNLGQAMTEAHKNLPTMREELAGLDSNPDPELNEKKRNKRREQLNKAIATAENLIREAPAQIEKLQAVSLVIFAKAVPVLDNMKARGDKLQSQDRAAMWNYYGYVYAILEQFEPARDAYLALLKEDEAPEDLKLQALYAAAQLSMLLEEYVRGVGYLEDWFKLATELGRRIRPSNHFLLAQGYFQLERYDDVLTRINIALTQSRSEGDLPMENWLRLLVATQFEKELFVEAEAPLELLVLLYPKREYWLQLQGLYGRLEQRQMQVSTLHLAWLQQLFENETEFIALAQQLQATEDPYEAGRVLMDGLEQEIVERDYDNLKMLGEMWNRAGETGKALDAYLEASELAENGEIHYRLAVMLNLENRIEESLQQVRTALEKGDMSQMLEARILVGQNLLDLGEREQALELFEKIAEEGHENRVTSWITHTRVQVEAVNRMEDIIERYREQEEEILTNLRSSDY